MEAWEDRLQPHGVSIRGIKLLSIVEVGKKADQGKRMCSAGLRDDLSGSLYCKVYTEANSLILRLSTLVRSTDTMPSGCTGEQHPETSFGASMHWLARLKVGSPNV